MSKVIIIGGGIAGLSAGIFCRKAGYETEIYEKNLIPGGNCSGWKKGPYTIDNCIHWMTGTLENTPQNDLWKEVGALGDDIPLHKRESFYSSEYNGQTVTLWRDVERTRREMLELSPEDEKEINKFINTTKIGMQIQSPKETPWSPLNAFKDTNLYINYPELIKNMAEYGGINLEQYSKKFKHPLLQKLISDFMNKDYESYWLIMSYSIFACGNGELPEGGSIGVVRHMTETYANLGGKLFLGKPVKQIVLNKKNINIDKEVFDPKSVNFSRIAKVAARNAVGIKLYDDQFIEADWIIAACDPNYLFNKHILSKRYVPSQIKQINKKKEKYPLYSSFQVAFSVESEMSEIDQHTIQCRPFKTGLQTTDRICIKNYRVYGDYIAPKGETVIQVSIVQHPEDYEYWKKLHANPDLYSTIKKNTADEILNRIEERFPQYKDKIHILDIWTPYTYNSRNNNYKGAYMRYITTITSRKAFIPCDITKLRNVFLASSWLRYPGGIPTAVTIGKVAASRIIKMDKKNTFQFLPVRIFHPQKKQLGEQ